MTQTVRTENDSLIEALGTAAPGEELAPGSIYAFKHADHVTTIDLLDRNLDRPRRKTGLITVEDLPSFTHYYNKHADSSSEVYVDIDAGRISAILDAHEPTDDALDRDGTARWGGHRLVLRLAETDAWKRWTGIDRETLAQQTFAEFIDDNRADIRKPSAAEMLELVQQFQAIQKVTFKSATILNNGDRRLSYSEETDAGAGPNGQLTVPSVLELGIAPFEDSEPYVVTARFRYRIPGGQLRMGILLDNADDVRRDAVKTVVGKLQEALGIVIMRGTPASA